MEMMGDNPEMSRRNDTKMSPDQFHKLQEMQSKLTGEQMSAMQAASAGGTNLTDSQMDTLVDMLKTNGDVLKDLAKSYMPGMTDAQLEAQIKALQNANPAHLKMALKAAGTLSKVGKPAAKVYAKVDKVTGGYAKYIAAALAILVLYLLAVYTWAFLKWTYAASFRRRLLQLSLPTTLATAVVSDGLENNNDDEIDEFAF